MAVEARWILWSGDDQVTVAVEPDLRFPKYVEAFVIGEDQMRVDLRIAAVFDASTERYVVDGLEVRRRSPGEDVTGAELRSIRVQDYLRQAVQSAMRSGRVKEPSPLFGVEFELTAEEADRVRAQGPSSSEALRWTARIYKFAVALNEPPAKAVQEQLGLTVPTASVWIRRARDTGVLVSPDRVVTESEWSAFSKARRALADSEWPT